MTELTSRTPEDLKRRAAENKRKLRQRQADALAQAAPEGWVLASSVGKYALRKEGMTRVTFDRAQGTVTLQRGLYARQITLSNPDNYEVLVNFYIHVGYQRVKDQRGVLVLDKVQP